MAYSCDLPKLAGQQSTGDRDLRYGMVWYSFGGIVWYGGGQMTSEFIHEEISIMDYNELS